VDAQVLLIPEERDYSVRSIAKAQLQSGSVFHKRSEVLTDRSDHIPGGFGSRAGVFLEIGSDHLDEWFVDRDQDVEVE
jgi:hypothetical protein